MKTSAETPIVFSKACELFMEDLTRSMKVLDGDHARQDEKDPASQTHKLNCYRIATDIFYFLVSTTMVKSEILES